MTQFKTVDELKDVTLMAASLKKARKAANGGKFVFFFTCSAVDGPVLMLGLPGKALHKPLIKELMAGGKPIKGDYKASEGTIYFYPKKEVNAKRMQKTICVIGKKNKVNLPPDNVVVHPPAMVQSLKEEEEREKNERIEELNSRGVTNRTTVGHIDNAMGKVGKLGRKVGSLGSKLKEALKKKQTPDPKLVIRTILEEGTVPINPKTVEQPEVPEFIKLTLLESKSLYKQTEEALESHTAANEARLQLAQSQATLGALVKAAETLHAKNGLPEKIVNEMQPTVTRLINDIEKQKLVIQQSVDRNAALELARRKELQSEWSEKDQTELDRLQKAVIERDEEIVRRDEEIKQLERSLQAQEEAQSKKLEALRKKWDRLNAYEEKLEKFEAELPGQRREQDQLIQKCADRVQQLQQKLQKGSNEKLETQLKVAQEKLDQARLERTNLDKMAETVRSNFEKKLKMVEEAEDQLDAGDTQKQEDRSKLLKDERTHAEKQVEQANLAILKNKQLIEGYGKQLDEAELAFEQDATLSGVYDEQDARDAQENRKLLSEKATVLQEADKALQEALDQRDSLQWEIKQLHLQKNDAKISLEKKQEAAKKLGQLRDTLLKSESGLTTLRGDAESARMAHQQAQRTVEQDRKTLEAVSEKMPGHFAKIKQLRIALDEARDEQVLELGRLQQVKEEEAEIKRQQDLQQNLDEAMTLLDENDQLSKLLRKMGSLEKLGVTLAKTTVLSDDESLKRLRERTDVDVMREQVEKIDADIRKSNEGLKPEDQQMLLSDMVSKLIQKTEEMRAKGATPEQMFQVWDRIPDALTPEKYVREAQNWRKMQEQLAREMTTHKKENPEKSIKDAFLSAMEEAKEKLEKGSTYTGVLKKGVGLVDKATGLPLKTVKAAATLAEAPEKVVKVLEMLKGMTEVLPGMGDLTDKVMGPLMPLIQTISGLSKLIAQSEAADKIKKVEEATKSARLAINSGVTLLDETVKTVEKVEDKNEKIQKSSDPIKTLMLKEDLADVVATLIKTAIKLGLNIAGTVLPLIGAISDGIDGLAHIIEAIKRGKMAFEDAILEEDAEFLKSDLKDSVTQSKNHEFELFAENSIKGLAKGAQAAGKATMDITKLAGGQDGGGAMIAGTTVKVTGMVVYSGMTIVVQIKSWAMAAYCEVLALKAANGDTAAQRKIFKHSGKYAKGLLALMAKENDPVALAYIKSRGLTPEMVEKSSPEIIRMYLLRRSRESNFKEGPGTLEKIKKGLNTAASAVEKVVDAVDQLGKLIHKSTWDKFASTDFECDLKVVGDLCAELEGARKLLRESDDKELIEQTTVLEKKLQGLRTALLTSTTILQDRLQVAISTEQGLRSEKRTKDAAFATGFVNVVEARLGDHWATLDQLAQVV